MSNSHLPDPLQQLTEDIHALVAEVQQRTGLNSRWSGVANIVVGARYSGAKRWNCDIDINQNILNQPRRYSTALHEVLHSVSIGLAEFAYDANLGYEEGVVEQCTRLLRDEIFAAMSLQGPFDIRTSYDVEIDALEELRALTTKHEREFYLNLLHTSLEDREEVVLQWIQTANPSKDRMQIEQETWLLRKALKP